MDPEEPVAWWPGPLDVQRLASSAVEASREAAERLSQVRGQRWQVGTSSELIAASFAALDHLRVDGRPAEAWAPLSGFFRAGDGWVRLHANYPHHAQVITRLYGTDDRAALEQRLREHSALEIEAAVTAEQGVAAAVRTPAEWNETEHGRATAGDPWLTTAVSGERDVPSGGDLPLSGVRVLDLTRVIAGPTCSQLLACLGADVLRVDPPGRPELLDQYLSNGMGKRSTLLDLQSQRAELDALLPQADVVLLGYRPGSLSRFGLDPDELAGRFPGLIVASLSAWGERGPWAQRSGFDSIVQAACGIATICADPDRTDGRPGALPVQALDHSTGYLMAAEAMDLLSDGRGGVIRVSLLGAARTLLAYESQPGSEVASLAVPTVTVDSPHGTLTAVPPPLTLDGNTLERPIEGYGRGNPFWLV
ncbi:CoA transferase [Ammonicoccus fulvus]|uniref:CoA transferase n=1 Tax=Ammonicoccus fulvus TaxID=3138240 RepID=A0ABZ3FPD4_9ACTN